ncbi:MAG: hypothetical protein M1819_004218 [Sarea resinae]|nr:MAG: hypothetical protein M1819_004218 [Sarea resinae]
MICPSLTANAPFALLLLMLLLALLLLGFAAADTSIHTHDASFTPDFVLRVTAQNFSQACYERYSTIINGSSPGPEIRLQEGTTSWIRVYNDMEDLNLTMHWHGLTMMVAPFSDGTPLASQWPIPPSHFFDYEIHAEEGYAGTYFYHSHVGFQAVSASGPLIISEPPSTNATATTTTNTIPHEYDDERIIYLSDFFAKTDAEIERGLTSTNFSWSGETDAVLVNGQGRTASNATGECQLASIDVDPGKVYRLRFIGATALSFVSLALQDHAFAIIAADGKYTQPYNTSILQIASGQRFDVLLQTRTLDELNGTTQFYFQLTTLERPITSTFFAALTYNTSTTSPDLITVPSPPPLPIASTVPGWLDYALQPLTPSPDFPTLSEVTRRITIRMHQNITKTATDPDYLVWLQGGLSPNTSSNSGEGVPWTASFPSTPYLVSIYESTYPFAAAYNAALANAGLDTTTRTYPCKMNEVLEIVLQNAAATNGGLDTHPFHAHGGHYFDLGGGNGTYDAVANEARLAAQNAQPVKRDTTVVYRYIPRVEAPGTELGWRAWRLRVSDPGV